MIFTVLNKDGGEVFQTDDIMQVCSEGAKRGGVAVRENRR